MVAHDLCEENQADIFQVDRIRASSSRCSCWSSKDLGTGLREKIMYEASGSVACSSTYTGTVPTFPKNGCNSSAFPASLYGTRKPVGEVLTVSECTELCNADNTCFAALTRVIEKSTVPNSSSQRLMCDFMIPGGSTDIPLFASESMCPRTKQIQFKCAQWNVMARKIDFDFVRSEIPTDMQFECHALCEENKCSFFQLEGTLCKLWDANRTLPLEKVTYKPPNGVACSLSFTGRVSPFPEGGCDPGLFNLSFRGGRFRKKFVNSVSECTALCDENAFCSAGMTRVNEDVPGGGKLYCDLLLIDRQDDNLRLFPSESVCPRTKPFGFKSGQWYVFGPEHMVLPLERSDFACLKACSKMRMDISLFDNECKCWDSRWQPAASQYTFAAKTKHFSFSFEGYEPQVPPNGCEQIPLTGKRVLSKIVASTEECMDFCKLYPDSCTYALTREGPIAGKFICNTLKTAERYGDGYISVTYYPNESVCRK